MPKLATAQPIAVDIPEVPVSALSVDPGATTGVVWTVAGGGMMGQDVHVDLLPTVLRRIPPPAVVIIERYWALGPRSEASMTGCSAGWYVAGWWTALSPATQVVWQAPAARRPHIDRAKEIMRANRLATTSHTTDALAHLLTWLVDWSAPPSRTCVSNDC